MKSPYDQSLIKGLTNMGFNCICTKHMSFKIGGTTKGPRNTLVGFALLCFACFVCFRKKERKKRGRRRDWELMMYLSKGRQTPMHDGDGIEKEKQQPKPKSEKMMIGGGGGEELESSLLQFVQEHHQTSLRLGEQTEKAKKEALKIGMRVSDVLVDTVNGGVQECFINEKRIEHEIRALTATAIRYTRQTDQWLAASHSINSVLKEIGDFENWMKTMDYDCKVINTAIRNIYRI